MELLILGIKTSNQFCALLYVYCYISLLPLVQKSLFSLFEAKTKEKYKSSMYVCMMCVYVHVHVRDREGAT